MYLHSVSVHTKNYGVILPHINALSQGRCYHQMAIYKKWPLRPNAGTVIYSSIIYSILRMGMLTDTAKCTTYQFMAIERRRNHWPTEVAFYWHYFYVFKFRILSVFTTPTEMAGMRGSFVRKSCVKTNKLAFSRKGSDHKWRFFQTASGTFKSHA